MAINPLQFQAFGLNAPVRTKLSRDQFDPAAYLAANSDVAAAIQNGQFADAWQHYDLHGSNERSRPWALRSNYGEGDYMRIVTPEGNISGGGGIGAPDWLPGVTQYDPTKDPYSGQYTGAPIGGINPVGATFVPPSPVAAAPIQSGGTSPVPFNPIPVASSPTPATPTNFNLESGIFGQAPGNPNYGGGAGYTFNPMNMTLPNQFDAMNLPQYQGPLSAPITEGMFNAAQGIKNTVDANPVGQSQDLMKAISSMINGEGYTTGDPNQMMAKFRAPSAGLDEAGRTGFQTVGTFNPSNLSGFNASLSGLNNNAPAGTDTSRSNAAINSILNGTANANVDPRMRALQDSTLGSFQTALSAPRFDNTEMFRNLKTVFEGDLADQTAELQEQFSGLGLGVGSTDRLNRIASNAGNARARFGAEMGDLSSRSFEAAEARRLGAINSAGGVGDLLQAGTQNALSSLQAIMANERLPFAEKMALRDQFISTLPVQLQAAVTPFVQEMEFAQTVLDPAAQRRLSAVTNSAGFDDAAMQRVMSERELQERARTAALSAGVATRGQDIDVYGQKLQGVNNLFNAESIMRGAADEEVMRNYAEFARTQGGGFQQMLAYLNSLPEGTVAVGPSTASQGADFIGSLASNPELLGTLIKLIGGKG